MMMLGDQFIQGQTVLRQAFTVAAVCGRIFPKNDHYMVTRYLDSYIRIEVGSFVNSDKNHVYIAQLLPDHPHSIRVAEGYVFGDGRPAIPMLFSPSDTGVAPVTNHFFPFFRRVPQPAPLIPFERRITTLYNLCYVGAVKLSWHDLAHGHAPGGNGGWSQILHDVPVCRPYTPDESDSP